MLRPGAPRRRRDPQRRVRFNLPEDYLKKEPIKGILREPLSTSSNLDISSLKRRSSAPLSSRSGGMGMTRSIREKTHALENLRGLRDYVKEACNFHGDDKRMALSVPSVDDLADLIKYVGELRPDAAAETVIRRDYKMLRSIMDSTKRFPHEQLMHESQYESDHEANYFRAARGRDRRRAEHSLYRFISRQLQLPYDEIRTMRSIARHRLIQEAFRARIIKFARPHTSRNAIANNIASSIYSAIPGHGGNRQHISSNQSQGTGSAPHSPAGRMHTAPHSSLTDPPPGLRRAYDAVTGMPFDYEPLPEFSLPGSSFDRGGINPQPKIKRRNTPAPPSHRNDGSSSYLGDTRPLSNRTGYSNTLHQNYPVDPIVGNTTQSHISPLMHSRTPPQPVARSPYSELPKGYGAGYQQDGYGYSAYQHTNNPSLYQNKNSAYTTGNMHPRTPPRNPAVPPGYGGASRSGYQPDNYGPSPRQLSTGFPQSPGFGKTPPQSRPGYLPHVTPPMTNELPQDINLSNTNAYNYVHPMSGPSSNGREKKGYNGNQHRY